MKRRPATATGKNPPEQFTGGVALVGTRDGAVIRATHGQTICEEHWHGAAPDRFMEHLAMLENADAPAITTTWLEHADYAGAHTTTPED
jgi:hypothetical protein